MASFRELGSEIVGDVLGGASGPLGDLFQDKHGTSSFSFPLDVEGVGQRHFIRFNIVNVQGATFDIPERNTEQADESASGEFLGGLAGGAISDAIGGGVGGVVGGIGGNITTNILEQTGVGSALDAGIGAVTGAASGLIGGVTAGVGAVAGQIVGGVEGLAAGAIGAISGFAEELAGALPPSVESTFGKIKSDSVAFAESISDQKPANADSVMDWLGLSTDFSSGKGGNSQTQADIVMYVPFNINETYQTNWSGGGLGLAGVLGEKLTTATALREGASKLFEGVKEELKTNKTRRGGGAEVVGNIGNTILQNENIKKKLLQNENLVINPHFGIYFDSPSPRNFVFDFKLSPRNAAEALEIQKIIRTFKKYAAPIYNDTGSLRYWDYPSMFQIEYWNSDLLHQFKRCALTNITVNYSGTGTNHTFYDGNPIQTDLTLTFMESELLTKQDIEKGY